MTARLAALIILGGATLVALWPDAQEEHQHTAPNREFVRVIAMAPSYCETVAALGQGHRVVGKTTYCEAASLAHAPVIGSFQDVNFEAVMALKPDLVLAVPHVMAKPIIERLRQENIVVYAHQPDSLVDIKLIITDLARLLHAQPQGKALNTQIDETLAQARAQVANLPHLNSNSIIIAVSHSPFVVAGKNSFPSQVIEHLGLRNLATAQNSWPIWSLESLIANPPDIILLLDGENLAHYERLFALLHLTERNPSLRILRPDRRIFNSPSPRIIEDTKSLIKILERLA